MTLLNLIDIETPWGYRTFELHQGDITQLDLKVDVPVSLAVKNSYDSIRKDSSRSLIENWQMTSKGHPIRATSFVSCFRL